MDAQSYLSPLKLHSSLLRRRKRSQLVRFTPSIEQALHIELSIRFDGQQQSSTLPLTRR
jgi:hypothetical protein